jgi:hypothetical protein
VDAIPPPPPSAPTPYVPQAAPPKAGSKRWLVVGLVVVVLIGVLGGGAAFANASLSSTYSPQRAVADYFSAQRRGDVTGMLANATYLKGNATYAQFFTKQALVAMMSIPQNTAITDVKVVSTADVDASTSRVAVSMTWAGNQRTHAYIVRKDTSRVHYALYNSWRVEIPMVTINVSLPNQPGVILLDSMDMPVGATPTAIQAIEGYHSVTMIYNDFYDTLAQTADGVDSSPTVSFPSKVNSTFTAAAATSIKAALVSCDASVYSDCINHPYQAPSGKYVGFTGFPGYSEIDAYSTWSFAFSSDPTAGMILTVTTEPGKLTASGQCALTMTVDGSKNYNFAGSWTGTVIFKNGTFTTSVNYNCTKVKV